MVLLGARDHDCPTRMRLASALTLAGWHIAVPALGSFLLSPCANFNAAACCAPVL